MKIKILFFVLSVSFFSYSQIANQPSPLTICDGDDDGFAEFNLTNADGDVLGDQNSNDFSVSYYETQADANANNNPLVASYINVLNPQTIYVRVENINTGNYETTTLQLEVLSLPEMDLEEELTANGYGVCDDGDNFVQFDFDVVVTPDVYDTQDPAEYALSYHLTQINAEDGTNAIENTSNYTNITNPQTIYIRLESVASGCVTIGNFNLIVNPLPMVTSVEDYTHCEMNTDGVYEGFDFTTMTDAILNGQNSAIFTVSYHDNQVSAELGINDINTGWTYTNTSNPQTIYVNITNTLTGCDVSTLTFELQVNESALANSDMDPILYQVCDDNMEFDGDPTDDMVEFDLFSQNPLVLDGLDPVNYIVSYYATQADADAATNALPQLYTNTVNPQVIVVRVDNDTMVGGVDSSDCYATAEITLQVNPMPSFDLEDSYLLCINTNGTEVIGSPTVDTGLSAAEGYTFVWYLEGVEQPQYADMGSITPTEGGTYSVVVTSAQGCSTIVGGSNTVTVVEVSEPPVINASITSSPCAGNNVITVQAGITTINSIGLYEFKLDEEAWQVNTPNDDIYAFENVSVGNHTITARDINGCGETSISITVLECIDSDSDGIQDSDEDLNSNGNLDDDDTDDDTIPNYLDDDDDGDLVLTIDEDYNNNGDPTDDDTDMSGTPDYLEANVALSIDEFNPSSTKLSIYPNPTKGVVNIEYNDILVEKMSVNIIDIQGKKVLSRVIGGVLGHIQLNVGNLQKGMYFVKFKRNNKAIIKKLIVE